ncbi:MAG TPA: PAS domain-containing protein [Kofleriaceae bacterium]|nr:PAS domain-containing protein [Kofleriaceae bacterium]
MRAFVRELRDEIIASWRDAARELPSARDMSAVTLLDHIPELLDEIGDIAEEIASSASPTPVLEAARRHALDRLGDGFDITTIVRELSLLRDAALSAWEQHAGDRPIAMGDLRALNLAIDRAIAVSASRYTQVHARTLAGIDRISTASFESSDLDDLMRRLLVVFLETTPAVDTAAILLAEDDRLFVRATAGLEAELDRGDSIAFGDGFAGTIAAQRAPMQLRTAYQDPLTTNAVIRKHKVLALYGVPLIQDSRVIGVAQMGSLTAREFSQEDRQFFGSMAARATLGIVHHLLRQDLAASEQRYKLIASDRERALAKLESLLAASPIGIAFVDRELRYVRINEALASLNDHPAEAHLGRSVGEVLPAFASTLEPMLRDVLETGRPVLNLEITRPPTTDPGDTRSLLASYFPVRARSGEITGVGGIVIDVTEAKRVQEALRIEQMRIGSILEHAPAAIWVKDPEGRIMLANHRLADVLGVDFERLQGQRSVDILPAEIAAAHEAHDQWVLREQHAIEVEEAVPSPQGTRTFLSIKFPIPGDPPLVGGIATEITQRKQMEEELRIAVRTRDDVLAVVSHDLRGPLGNVEMSATLLLGQLAADNWARRHLELIHRSCTRMEHLINDLLDTASIRAGRLHLNIQPESADAILAEALDLHLPLAEERGIRLVRESNVTGIDIACDRHRILQVFGNLIGNAIKFCRSGDTITLGAEADGHCIVFSVLDTGPGIQPDAAAHLFQAYWSAPDHVKQGAGLGLYIARGIVEQHRGQIWVERGQDVGARFLFTLSIWQIADAAGSGLLASSP